jgi:hypothetical protein
MCSKLNSKGIIKNIDDVFKVEFMNELKSYKYYDTDDIERSVRNYFDVVLLEKEILSGVMLSFEGECNDMNCICLERKITVIQNMSPSGSSENYMMMDCFQQKVL